MQLSEYIAKNEVKKIVVSVNDEQNEGYTRKMSFSGASLLAPNFRPAGDYRADCVASAFVTAGGAIVIHMEDGDGGTLQTYQSIEEFLDSDEAENVKSAVASELGVEYVEEVAL
jgi:hypothetical protein